MKKIFLLFLTMFIVYMVGMVPRYIVKDYKEIELLETKSIKYLPTYENIGVVKKNKSIELLANKDMIITEKLIKNGFVNSGEKIGNVQYELGNENILVSNISDDIDKYKAMQAMLNKDIDINDKKIQDIINTYKISSNIIEKKEDCNEYLTSPISGDIEWSVFGNNIFVPKGATLCKIYNNDYVTVHCNIKEEELPKYKIGMKVNIKSKDGNMCVGYITDIVKAVKNTIKDNSVMPMIEIVIKADGGENLLIGSSVNCVIEDFEEKEILTVPFTAINQDNIGEYVMLYDNGEYRKQYITVGEELGNSTIISSGLCDSDIIVSDISNYNLQDKHIITKIG